MVLSATLRIELLGGFVVHRGSVRIPRGSWRLRKAGHVVKLLALAQGHRLHRDVIVDALWPEFAPEAATNNLHRTLYEARRVLEPGRPVGRPSSFLKLQDDLIDLSPGMPVQVDVGAFRAAADVARRLRAPEHYESALARFPGDLLPEDRFEDWTIAPREGLRALRLALFLELAALRAGRAEHQAAIEAFAAAVAIDPTHEVAQTELVRSYAMVGRRAEAIRQFERFREALRRDLGEEPPAGLERFIRDLIVGRGAPSPAARTHQVAEGRRVREDRGRWLAGGRE